MSKLQLLRSESTINIIRNPSVELDLDDWASAGATITRSTDEARHGRYSVKVVTDGILNNEGAHVRSFPDTSQTFYAGSAYIRGSGRVRLAVRDGLNGNEAVSDAFTLNPDRWIRIEDVLGQTGPVISDDLAVHVETVGVQAATFYIDAVQLEEKAYSTTYIDGDQEGGRWNIARHGSVSTRLDNWRQGGRWIDLDEEDLGLYVTVTTGLGMPPLTHNVQGKALLPGIEFQSTKILERVIQATFFIRNPKAPRGALERLHEVRQDLIDIIKPDRVDPDQLFMMRYNGAAFSVEIPVIYEAGLEFSGDLRNQSFNSFAVRFLATDPFWAEDNQDVAILDPIEVLQTQNGLLAKVNGEWTNLGNANGFVVSLAIGPDGQLYASGNFTTIGGVGANYIARWDGENWYPLGTGFDAVGNNIAFGPDGDLYCAGSFTSAGGVANTRGIARWDGSAWNSVGGGLDNSAFSIAFAPDGSFYIVGNFLNADPNGGAPVTVNRIARFQNNTWQALVDTGTGLGNGFDAGGLEVAVAGDGRVYVGGTFTSAGGVADTQFIAMWDPVNEIFVSLGGDAEPALGYVTAIAVAPDGRVYAGGDFTTIGGVAANRAAVWNGAVWTALAGGVDDNVRWIFIKSTTEIYYVGDFTQAADINDIAIPNTDHIAIWDGSQWIPEEITAPTNLTRMRNVVFNQGNIYYSGEGALADAFVSVPNEVTSRATASSYPIVFFKRTDGTSATIIMIKNENSERTVKFTYEMADGEEVEIDFRPGRRAVRSSLFSNAITISEVLQNQLGEIIPGSDFANFTLLPEDNTISVFVSIVGATTLEASMRWVPLHWAADAVAG